MIPLRTDLILVPQGESCTIEQFQKALEHLHESLQGSWVSFEIVATSQNIGLYITSRASITEAVQSELYSILPGAEILTVADHTDAFEKAQSVVCADLGLTFGPLLPLQTNYQSGATALSGLFSVLTRCRPQEYFIFQVIISPLDDSTAHHMKLKFSSSTERLRQRLRPKFAFKKNVLSGVLEGLDLKKRSRHFKTSMRFGIASNESPEAVQVSLQAGIRALLKSNTLDSNRLKVSSSETGSKALHKIKERSFKGGYLMTSAEIATFFHIPDEHDVPNILHVLSKRHAPPVEIPTDTTSQEISFFGETNYRDRQVPFGFYREDRRRHLYLCGKSGSGKSKLLEQLIINDILAGKGVGVLDPHGDLVDNVLEFVPKSRIKDVVIFDPSDTEFPASFNPLEQVAPNLKMRVSIGFIEIFKKLFGSNWSPRLEHVLRYTTLALLDTPGTTILSILQMLTDKKYRQGIVAGIKDDVVKNFWVTEFAGWSERFDNEAITPLVNKVGQFVATNMIRNIVGQPDNRFKFREFMDSQKIVLMKISKGILGEENASLLGAIAITKIYQAAMSRADTPEKDRVDFYLYVDEFQNFATETFGEILSEARKYRLNLTIANQFLGQLDNKMRRTVFGNVGSLLSFRVGAEDALILTDEFKPRFQARDIINLGVREFILKMSIKGEIKEAFSAKTLPVIPPKIHFTEECMKASRATYAVSRKEVEAKLAPQEKGPEGSFQKVITATVNASPQEDQFLEPPI